MRAGWRGASQAGESGRRSYGQNDPSGVFRRVLVFDDPCIIIMYARAKTEPWKAKSVTRLMGISIEPMTSRLLPDERVLTAELVADRSYGQTPSGRCRQVKAHHIASSGWFLNDVGKALKERI